MPTGPSPVPDPEVELVVPAKISAQIDYRERAGRAPAVLLLSVVSGANGCSGGGDLRVESNFGAEDLEVIVRGYSRASAPVPEGVSCTQAVVHSSAFVPLPDAWLAADGVHPIRIRLGDRSNELFLERRDALLLARAGSHHNVSMADVAILRFPEDVWSLSPCKPPWRDGNDAITELERQLQASGRLARNKYPQIPVGRPSFPAIPHPVFYVIARHDEDMPIAQPSRASKLCLRRPS